MAKKKVSRAKYKIGIPLQLQDVDQKETLQEVKVVLENEAGERVSSAARFDKKHTAIVDFSFDKHPGNLRAYVGPADATDEEVTKLQSLRFNITRTQWQNRPSLRLQLVPIRPYFWLIWLRWCRIFTVRGRVVCPDGKPVPGAKVCASDVDWFWWWRSTQQVGCTTTAEDGTFVLRFRWCCYWWPWWWYRSRVWQLENRLVERLLPEVRTLSPDTVIEPTPQPSLELFENLSSAQRTQPVSAQFKVGRALGLRSTLQRLRQPLNLPKKLRLWPWFPWEPWNDCSPDLIFKVTQQVGGVETTILQENLFDTRWNVGTNTNVTLVVDNDALCVDDTPPPDGDCITPFLICHANLNSIGGNLGAPSAPVGYYNPAAATSNADSPYAGNIRIDGEFGSASQADYYEFEWFNPAISDWDALPPGTFIGPTRTFYGPALPAGPIDFHTQGFPVTVIDGRNVVESRQHFEANNGAGTWEVVTPGSRWWTKNKRLLGYLRSNFGPFHDGTFRLRLKSWKLNGEALENPTILGFCGADDQFTNSIVLRTDNRVITTGGTDAHGHPCGEGTVHNCTIEPDTAFLRLFFRSTDGTVTPVDPCGDYQVRPGDRFVIEFAAHDPERHLSHYTLGLTWGDSHFRNMLGAAVGGTLSAATAPAAWAPAAAQVGPTYQRARLDGAPSPIWAGGSIRLEADAANVFQETCAYQLTLRAFKRTIVNCNYNELHRNRSEFSFTVRV